MTNVYYVGTTKVGIKECYHIKKKKTIRIITEEQEPRQSDLEHTVPERSSPESDDDWLEMARAAMPAPEKPRTEEQIELDKRLEEISKRPQSDISAKLQNLIDVHDAKIRELQDEEKAKYWWEDDNQPQEESSSSQMSE